MSHDDSAPASPWNWLLTYPDIRSCIVTLANDDCDVVDLLRPLSPLFPDVVFVANPRREVMHRSQGNEISLSDKEGLSEAVAAEVASQDHVEK